MANNILKEAHEYFKEQIRMYGNNDDVYRAAGTIELNTGSKTWVVWDHIKGIVANVYMENKYVPHRANNTVSKIPEKYIKEANEMAIALVDIYFDGLDYYVEECL